MKIYARCLVMLFLMGVSSNLYAQEWVAYNQSQIQAVYVQPQPIVVYQWVPYVVQQNVIVEQRRLFCVNQTIVSRPTIQFVLQPVVVYK